MNIRQLLCATTITALVLTLGSMPAHAQPTPEESIEYRQAVYTVVLWNFSPLVAMVKGETEFDRDIFITRAKNLAALSQMPLEGFNHASGETRTAALPAIWEDKADFESRMGDFQDATRKLADMAPEAEQSALFEQFKNVANTCRNCHDDYREKD